MNNRDLLIDIIHDHQLERREIAELLSVSRETVDLWLLPQEAAQREAVPDMAIELLGFKLPAKPSTDP